MEIGSLILVIEKLQTLEKDFGPKIYPRKKACYIHISESGHFILCHHSSVSGTGSIKCPRKRRENIVAIKKKRE